MSLHPLNDPASTASRQGTSSPIHDAIPRFAASLLQHAVQSWTEALSEPTSRSNRLAAWLLRALPEPLEPLPTELHDAEDVAVLRWLLVQSEQSSYQSVSASTEAIPDSHWECLIASLHSALSLASTQTAFADAVQRAATRQVYNLAYGLTHEINNPLGNIMARAQRLIPTVISEADKRSLATIVDQSQRAHEMLAEVMRAVQPAPLQLVSTDVRDPMQRAFESLRAEAERLRVRWSMQPSDRPLFAAIDADAMVEVLRVLGRNALDVVRPSDAIDWSVSEVHRDPSPASSLPAALGSAPRWLCIAVRDTGPGLSAEAARSAFDLFYSGREHGRGLGVSLAVAHRIVAECGGTLRLRSESGAGCTAEIVLPQSTPPPRSRPMVRV
ncbi:MAG: ATP-binding protein [Pirellula sp.]